MPDRAKRHHQVPRAYLNRLGSDGKVRVRWRDGKAYETSTLNVAVGSGFYDVPDPEGGDSSRVEAELAVADGAAAPLFVEGPDGRKVRESEALHTFVPRRPQHHQGIRAHRHHGCGSRVDRLPRSRYQDPVALGSAMPSVLASRVSARPSARKAPGRSVRGCLLEPRRRQPE